MTTAALAAFPLLLAATGAIEMFSMSNEKALLQTAADAGALAGAGRMSVLNANTISDATAVATETAMHNVSGARDPSIFSFTVAVDQTAGTVTVNGLANHISIADLIGLGNTQIHTTATAEALQKTPLCVLQTGDGGMTLDDQAAIKAPGCLVHANADISVANGALIQAATVEAVGKVLGPVQPAGHSGALNIADPFANMNLTPPTKCAKGGSLLPIKLGGDTLTLAPGVHCLPIIAIGNGRVFLQPGEHYFMLPLIMTENSSLEGDDVALIFGANENFQFADQAAVRLTARRSGPFAGFLIVTTRDNRQTFKIESGNVSELLGTIYIPNAELEVATTGRVAQDSAWSVIVASRLTLKKNPVLTINKNYAGSGVPVPDGVGPSSGVVLKQ